MSKSPDDLQHPQDVDIDLSNCDREPIHVPGSIQPHGVLLAVDEMDLRIVQASANSKDMTGWESSDLLGNNLSLVLGISQTTSFRETLQSDRLQNMNPLKLKVGRNGTGKLVNAIMHRHHGVLFIEFEPAGDPIDAPLKAYHMVQGAISKVQNATTLQELWRATAHEVRKLIEFDRVMIYKFDRSGNGEVLDEEVAEGREPYKGLHYPASDIPQQARLLYSLNWIRHIPDINYKPAELVPLIYPLTRELTDLTYSTLRSVSPIHVEYLQNMGVASSMSISLISEMNLWGLIACHNYTPKFVPYEMRAACELLGQVVSSRMMTLEGAEHTQYKSRTNVMQARFLELLSLNRDLKSALVDGSPNLMEYVPCVGCAVCVGDECHVAGETPSKDQIGKLTRRLRRFGSPVFATDDLHSTFPEALEFKDKASGLLSLTISKNRNIYLMWFRPEQEQTVNWGGNPHKTVQQDSDMRLHPRKSFSLWKEVVLNKSVAWTAAEIQSATELRSTLMGLLLNWSDTVRVNKE